MALGKVIKALNSKKIKINITAVYSAKQTQRILKNINKKTKVIISIFAGRIANTGIDPEPIMKFAVDLTKESPEQEILWASPREALNVIQAERCGCDIITVTPDILRAIDGFGKDLEEFSLETVKMFYDDATTAGYSL